MATSVESVSKDDGPSEESTITPPSTTNTMRGLPDDDHHNLLHDTILRTFWLFQLCVSAPVSVALGVSAFVRLVEVHGAVYDFVASLLCSMMAAIIVFILIIQRKTFEQGIPIDLTMKFEEAKSALATSLWVWEMVDSGIQPTTMWNRRGPRMAAAGVSALILFMLFYPSAIYVAREYRRKYIAVAAFKTVEQEEESMEYTPLLHTRSSMA